MNVYDFDGTVYGGDSTVDFYLFCVRRHIKVLEAVPIQISGCFLYFTKRINKTQFKEMFYRFLKYLESPEKDINEFWEKNSSRIKKWYLTQHKGDDVIISASPEFLLTPICRELGVGELIASKVDIHSGKYNGENCRGTEKLKRFKERFGNIRIERFYSDNESDNPMTEIANENFLIRGNKILSWK